MNALVLTKKEQRKSLSTMKKKKKGVQKSVLRAPESAEIRKPKLQSHTIEEIHNILESLLPSARIQVPESQGSGKVNPNETTNVDISQNKLRRSQLLLGVNAVSKGLQNETADSVLMADDIEPKMMIEHLQVLCTLKNIPYIFMPHFRDLTKKTLGFSCIALGFKKNFTEFLPVINVIKSAVSLTSSNVKEVVKLCDSKMEDIKTENMDEKAETQNEFNYLLRSSSSQRVFKPDCIADDNDSKTEGIEFLPFGNDTESDRLSPADSMENTFEENKRPLKKGLGKRRGHMTPSDDFSPARKRKRDCDTGKKGGDSKRENIFVKYSQTKISKIGSNPNREKNKKDFKKI